MKYSRGKSYHIFNTIYSMSIVRGGSNNMYSSLKNVQIIVALLKKYLIKHVVISAGTRHTPLVYSLEHDAFFECYSIVDERSASFFAIGLIEELREPVAICCTSGTAAANYVSAANEAFYQQLPLLILTADRNHYYMFQQEEQMIPQDNLYSDVCNKVVTLPHVRDDKDFWYCSRLVNEALLELNHRELGPVHINYVVENDYPIKQGIIKFEAETLPDVRKIDRLTLEDSEKKWKQKAQKLLKSKILIIYGQQGPLTMEEAQYVEVFCQKYNCVISSDILSNLHSRYCIPTFTVTRCLTVDEFNLLCPDIVITMNGHTVSEIKSRLIELEKRFEHWHVSGKGDVSDPFKCLPDVIECSPIMFFRKFSELAEMSSMGKSYYNLWIDAFRRIGNAGSLMDETIDYSAVYATQQYLKNIPENSLIHIANSNSIRLANYFKIHDSVNVYCNRGAHGIDGSMSSFIGQSYVSKKLSFLLIGDLSFFYDMNALWNKYVCNNVRILVVNNSGGGIFHNYPGERNVPTINRHIAAEHHTSVKGWAEAIGFKYLYSMNKKEFDSVIADMFVKESETPIIMEVFTDKDVDTMAMNQLLKPYRTEISTLKGTVAKHMPDSMKKTLKSWLKK